MPFSKIGKPGETAHFAGWDSIKISLLDCSVCLCNIFVWVVSQEGGLIWNYAFRHLKAMAPHSSTLAWKIPWTEEPGGLQSMGSLRVGHDWATSLSLFTFMHWRRKWQPTPVFLPGESQGWGKLVGCRLWGRRVRHDWSDLAAAFRHHWNRSSHF